MINQNPSIEEIVDPNSEDIRRAYKIIENKLPYEERSDISHFTKTLMDAKEGRLDDDRYHFLISRENSEISGAITGYYISELDMGFVSNLAVKSGSGGKGIGTELRNGLLARFRDDSKDSKNEELSGILGEIEETNIWLRKILSNPNVFVFDINYIQPPLREGQEGKKNLVLYLQINEKLEKISTEKVTKILTAIYRNIYDINNPQENACFQDILNSIKNRKYISRKNIS